MSARPKNGRPVPVDIPDGETVVLVVGAGWVKWLDDGAMDAWSWEEEDPELDGTRRFVMGPAPSGRRCTCGHWESEHDTESPGPSSGCLYGWAKSDESGCKCTTPTYSDQTGEAADHDH
jgi:hypothetical protein